MDEKKKSAKKEVEDTMACSAFAEAGEPCPLDNEQRENEKQESCEMSVQDTMACSAFAEAGVSCPICEDK
jgi:hypothetical protein